MFTFVVLWYFVQTKWWPVNVRCKYSPFAFLRQCPIGRRRGNKISSGNVFFEVFETKFGCQIWFKIYLMKTRFFHRIWEFFWSRSFFLVFNIVVLYFLSRSSCGRLIYVVNIAHLLSSVEAPLGADAETRFQSAMCFLMSLNQNSTSQIWFKIYLMKTRFFHRIWEFFDHDHISWFSILWSCIFCPDQVVAG